MKLPVRLGGQEPSIFERQRQELDRQLPGSVEPITSYARVREIKATAELARGSGRLRPEPYFVPLEPPFVEYVHTDLNEIDRYTLDLRAPILTTPWERFVAKWKGTDGAVPLDWRPEERKATEEPAFLRIVTSKQDRVDLENATQFLMSVRRRIGFEVVGHRREVAMQFSCPQSYAQELAGILQTHYEVSEFRLDDEDALWRVDGKRSWIAEYGLATSHIVPLRTLDGFSVEPMQVLMGVLDEVDEDEAAGLQILFEPCRFPWTQNLRKVVVDELTQKPIFEEPDPVECVRRKIVVPMFAVSVRTVATSPRLLERFLAYVNPFATEYNRLVPLTDGVDGDLWAL